MEQNISLYPKGIPRSSPEHCRVAERDEEVVELSEAGTLSTRTHGTSSNRGETKPAMSPWTKPPKSGSSQRRTTPHTLMHLTYKKKFAYQKRNANIGRNSFITETNLASKQ